MPVITTVTLTIPAKDAARASDVFERIASLLGELKEQAALSGVAVRWSPLEKEREVAASDKSALAAAAYLMQFVGPISPATIWTLCNEKPDAVGKVQTASPNAYISADDWQREFGFNWPIQPQQAFERLEKVGLMERLGRGQPPVWPAQTSQRGAWGVLYCLTAEGHAWFEREGLGHLKPEFIAQLAEVGQALQPYRDKKGRVQQFISREDVPEPPKPARVGRSGRVGRGEGRSSRSNATTEAPKNVEKW